MFQTPMQGRFRTRCTSSRVSRRAKGSSCSLSRILLQSGLGLNDNSEFIRRVENRGRGGPALIPHEIETALLRDFDDAPCHLTAVRKSQGKSGSVLW